MTVTITINNGYPTAHGPRYIVILEPGGERRLTPTGFRLLLTLAQADDWVPIDRLESYNTRQYLHKLALDLGLSCTDFVENVRTGCYRLHPDVTAVITAKARREIQGYFDPDHRLIALIKENPASK